MNWNINLSESKGSDVIAYCTGVAALPSTVLAVITDFCNQATGKVSLQTAGSYAKGYTLVISQGAARVAANA